MVVLDSATEKLVESPVGELEGKPGNLMLDLLRGKHFHYKKEDLVKEKDFHCSQFALQESLALQVWKVIGCRP